jgi:alpha-beta hydrolase superfamily lysophospholipase
MNSAPGPIPPSATPTINGLYAEQFLPSGTPKGVVLVTHGYAEHCGRYRELANVIVREGWAALSYDVRGHGQSPGVRGFIERFDAYLTDLAAMQAAARKLAQPNALRVEDLTSDPAKQQERRADKLCLDIATARWFTEAARAQAYVATHASRIKIPTTCLVGADDPIADPARARVIASQVLGATYHDLVGFKHEVFNETSRGQVFAEVRRVLTST